MAKAKKSASKSASKSAPKSKVDKSTREEREAIGERLRQEAVANRTPVR